MCESTHGVCECCVNSSTCGVIIGRGPWGDLYAVLNGLVVGFLGLEDEHERDDETTCDGGGSAAEDFANDYPGATIRDEPFTWAELGHDKDELSPEEARLTDDELASIEADLGHNESYDDFEMFY